MFQGVYEVKFPYELLPSKLNSYHELLSNMNSLNVYLRKQFSPAAG